jgi:hypothetical protein
VLSQQNLLKVLNEDLKVCRDAASTIPASDHGGKQQNILEYNTLLNHIRMAQEAGSDQDKLENVVCSLESNNFMGGYQHWRERSQA